MPTPSYPDPRLPAGTHSRCSRWGRQHPAGESAVVAGRWLADSVLLVGPPGIRLLALLKMPWPIQTRAFQPPLAAVLFQTPLTDDLRTPLHHEAPACSWPPLTGPLAWGRFGPYLAWGRFGPYPAYAAAETPRPHGGFQVRCKEPCCKEPRCNGLLQRCPCPHLFPSPRFRHPDHLRFFMSPGDSLRSSPLFRNSLL